MAGDKLRIFGLLLYKNFLVRKRHWKMALFVEILIPLLLFVSIWGARNLVARPPTELGKHAYPAQDQELHLPEGRKHLFVVPNNDFIKNIMKDVRECFKMNPGDKISWFDTEEAMLDTYDTYEPDSQKEEKVIAVIFEDKNINMSSNNLAYKIRIDGNIPTQLYTGLIPDMRNVFTHGFTGVQICVDESFIKQKRDNFNMRIFTQRMPIPPHTEPDVGDEVFREMFCGFALLAFLIPLCIETSYASNEKFLGINVLMSMNGVPNCLNLFSWLITSLIFSLFYVVPIVSLLNFTTTDDLALPFLYYGNSFIFWLVLTINVAHLITFGMHISAYFRRSLFMVTGILVLYIGSIALAKYGIKESSFTVVPYLGIFFPNILLFRACEEVNYYESIAKGIHINNLFRVGNPAYGKQGSIGMIFILSITGMIFHFIMANYVFALNPGKYGVKKHPLYFLKFFKRSKKSHDYDKVENFEFNDIDGKPFEPVAEGVFTPGIQIRNLRKTYKTNFLSSKVQALKGISVDFFQGQITALLGHNGAGKTTMMSILTGMISPSEGAVFVNGKSVKDNSDEILNDMGLCPQENMLFPHLSVSEQLLFFALLKNKENSRSTVKNEVRTFLQKLKLFEKRNSLPKQLSGGQKRRLCLGMALIGDSNTLILDEPTSGLDPESRRDIWNILLKMKGKKTILISTHDMEEADILGDRIAIVHSGLLRSYGTSMFLKKLLGRGNIEVTLSVESSFDPEKVKSYVDPQSEILNADGSKVVLSIPYTPELPDSLDKIETDKKELGVTGMSVSLITLEQVFLKVTRDNDEETESREVFTDTIEKLKGHQFLMHSAKALLIKKGIFALKNLSIYVIMLLLTVLSLVCISFISMGYVSNKGDNTEPTAITLDMYHDMVTAFKSDRSLTTDFGQVYKVVTEELHGKTVTDLREHGSFNDALVELGSRNFAIYNHLMLAAAEFTNRSGLVVATAFYNPTKAQFALPISINLVTNALLKGLVGNEGRITVTAQEFPSPDDHLTEYVLGNIGEIEAYVIALLTALFVYPAIALFVIPPARENLAGVKHLQRMSGVSCLNYWGTTFLFDFGVFFVVVLAVFVVGFVVMNCVLGLQMLGCVEVLIMTALFLLFAINVLPFIYIMSFWKRSTSAAVKLLSLLPIGLVAIEIIMTLVTEALMGQSDTMNMIRPIQKVIFLLTPYISFFHGEFSFLNVAKQNANCQRLSAIVDEKDVKMYSLTCFELQCVNGTCKNPLKYFGNFKEDVSLEASFLSLCLTPILYFGILCILEYNLISKLIARIFGGKPIDNDQTFEEQVKKIKQIIGSEISKIKKNETIVNGNVSNGKIETVENGTEEILPVTDEAKNHVFLVYELRKLFGRLVAVQDLSFGVYQSECFGLLGINGAGKSTTFKMMTGAEIPNHGTMYLDGQEFHKNTDIYLSQMGYCPQNDAIIRSFNAYDHLKLFACLRGVPADQVNKEVQKWIDRLNLKACASQPSGTYSGGNKRRLNIAIALIGMPKLILLDEPTTGVDPAARRSLWNVIQTCQASGQAVILTSHSMEECEALCNRLAIMVDGKLVCIGPPQELKQRFGAGYDIQLKLNPEKSREEASNIKKDISQSLDCEIIDANSGYLMYHVTTTEVTWKRMYDIMTELKNRYTCIEDFSVLSSTLEQLFLLFARNADRSFQKTKSA